ncbi:MAG TPA: hypothetical protein VNX28_17115 [Gemmataceae bacterium]|jgi:hypothetical protein|nr:hypothetical protein [Gemmataceae bacterium]
MVVAMGPCLHRLETDGFAVLPGVYSLDQVAAILDQLQAAISADEAGSSLRARSGIIYAARNIMVLWPRIKEIWKQPPLVDILTMVLGPEVGLVRVLYFDKPPGQSWALPWYKDTTIAVRDNRIPSSYFRKTDHQGRDSSRRDAQGSA